MIKTIFCLSMPGGHMTYISLITKLLLQHIPVQYTYIDAKGSAHNFEKYIPTHLEYNFNNNWDSWFQESLENYTFENVCVFKDSWASTNLDFWQNKLNSLNNTHCIISSPLTKVDWYYCWFNYAQKLPLGMYGQLKIMNYMLPLWHLLNNKHKFKSFVKSMPVFPLKENIILDIPNVRFASTQVLNDTFPYVIDNFLLQNKFNSCITQEILDFHKYFVSKQLTNYKLAIKLANNEKWQPRNLFDKVLFDWVETNPWEGLE